MSKNYEACCGIPAFCMSTAPCVTRTSFRHSAKVSDTQSIINECTQGSRTYTAGDTGETATLACCGNLSTCESDAPCSNRDKHQAFMEDDTQVKVAEIDPNGLAANKPGAKLDAGKVRVGLVMAGFARALMEVAKVGTAGANKYTPNGWMEVPNGIERYTDARDRHQLKEYIGEEIDPDFGYLHAAHECWNSLARLDLILREKEKVESF